MPKVFITESILEDTADAIRAKDGSTALITPAEFPQKIADIPTGGLPEALAKLLASEGDAITTIPDVTDLSTCKIAFGNSDGQNNRVRELHFPDLEKFTHGNPNYGTRYGGLVDAMMSNSTSGSSRLEVIDLPKCQYLFVGSPQGNTNYVVFGRLRQFNAPELTQLFGNFRQCSLPELRCPKMISNLGSWMFRQCTELKLVDTSTTSIQTNALYGCTQLSALVMRSTISGRPVTLANTNALTSTPIASGTGYIYVPRDMISDYESATNWTTYTGQFRAIEDYTDDGTLTGNFIMPSN